MMLLMMMMRVLTKRPLFITTTTPFPFPFPFSLLFVCSVHDHCVVAFGQAAAAAAVPLHARCSVHACVKYHCACMCAVVSCFFLAPVKGGGSAPDSRGWWPPSV